MAGKKDLAETIARRADMPVAQVNKFLTAFGDAVIETVSAGEKVTLPGVLSVERVERAARTGRNPQTGESISIPAGHAAKVSAGSKLKAAVKG